MTTRLWPVSLSSSLSFVAAITVILASSVSFSQMSPSSVTFANNLMPQPASLTATEGSLVLTPEFRAAATRFDGPRLDGAIYRALQQIRQRTGVPLSTKIAPAGSSAQLTVEVQGAGEKIQSLDEDESYSLTVTSSGARIEAATVVGAMHGLETLVQLVQPSGSDYVLPLVSIKDSPRFQWRGLMIDCGRHFEPMDVLKRTIDGMAAVKLNVFHWHLTEDQGFRIESKLYPRLTGIGSNGLFYTQQDAKDLVAYARARGIRVVPEFEMPGHSTAWQVAYPKLASGTPPDAVRTEFGIAPFALDPTREETYQFIARFLGEMATLFPDPYMHIGGDETPAPDWKTNPRILAFMRAHHLKDSEALQAYFNTRVLKILTGLHKHMVGWDEILNPALPKDIVIQSWRGEASLAKGAEQGYQGILSAPYYLDAMKTAATHYLADPLPSSSPLTPEQRKRVLGGEVCMWAEQLDEHTIDSRIWPRTAAIAERFWSPEKVIDVDDMYRRLNVVSIQLEGFGLRHLSHEDAALRALVGTQNINQLRTFASALEPVSFHDRYQQQKTSQLTVLDRFVDAVRPDPLSRYKIERLTRNFLKTPQSDTADQAALNQWFEAIANSVPAVEEQMQHSPLLAEAQTRAGQLPGLAKTAMDAIHLLSTGAKAPAGWKAASLAEIETAKKPSAVVRFTFIDSLTSLVNAVQK
ncbi:MAG TPA: beta-N-acetylhexosaminidase [Edaphobacter sp.]|nr:beta-N-acetylhexosaminidase [Edaphobacter sp.]